MINWDKINKKVNVNRVIVPIFVVILIILICVYFVILHKYIEKNVFVGKMEEIYEKNENPTFSIKKIYLCSSVNAIDTTQEQKLDTLDLYQYTDIAIYLDNHKEEGLNIANTVKQLYVDNISLKLDYNIGETSLVYTNLLKIGSREELGDMIANLKNIQKDRIDFNIPTTNEENIQLNYEEPTFYTDCSNPISLKYINKIAREYSIQKGDSATFDGSILEKVGIKPEDINVQIKFKINLINNNDDYYSNWVSLRVPLYDIYKGTSIKSKNTVGREYNFFTL